jgi:hypothetical protein
VLDGESLKRVGVGIQVNLDVFQGGLKGGETLAFQKCADGGGSIQDGGGSIQGTVDAFLRPDFLQILDQVDPLLRGSFLEHSHKFLVSRRSGGLAGTGLQFEVDKLRLVLVLCRKDFREEQGQHRLERRRLEFSPMAGEAGFLDWEPHLFSIGSDFYVLD